VNKASPGHREKTAQGAGRENRAHRVNKASPGHREKTAPGVGRESKARPENRGHRESKVSPGRTEIRGNPENKEPRATKGWLARRVYQAHRVNRDRQGSELLRRSNSTTPLCPSARAIPSN
jgi:hypothetical protein